jgi:hypothetical protein
MWKSDGAWIAVGVSALFVVVALAMHRIFVRILKNGATEPEQGEKHE